MSNDDIHELCGHLLMLMFLIMTLAWLLAAIKNETLLRDNYIIPKSEYNELRQDGKVWAYVRKDGKL